MCEASRPATAPELPPPVGSADPGAAAGARRARTPPQHRADRPAARRVGGGSGPVTPGRRVLAGAQSRGVDSVHDRRAARADGRRRREARREHSHEATATSVERGPPSGSRRPRIPPGRALIDQPAVRPDVSPLARRRRGGAGSSRGSRRMDGVRRAALARPRARSSAWRPTTPRPLSLARAAPR